MARDLMTISAIADRSALSVASIRRYVESGVVTPAWRGADGEPLFRETHLSRLIRVRELHPLEPTGDELSSILAILEALDDPTRASVHQTLLARLDAQVRRLVSTRLGQRSHVHASAPALLTALSESAGRPGRSRRWL